MATPKSSEHRGWFYDKENASLDLYFNGTEIWRVDATGVTVVTGTFTLFGDDVVNGYGAPDAGISWDTTDANANKLLVQLPAGGAVNVPVIAIGQSIESVDQGIHNGAVDPTIAIFGVGARTTGPIIEFRKTRGTLAAPTVVTAGDDLGTIDFYSAVANNEWVRGASIRADSAGSPATTRGAANLSFNVGTDAAPTVMTERLLITGDGQINVTPLTDTTFANGTGVIIGGTAQLTVGGVIPELQVVGTTTGVDGSAALVTASTTNSAQSTLSIVKGGNAALGTFTTVAQGEALGQIAWFGDDGVDYATAGARIRAIVNAAGTVAASRVPSDLIFDVDPGGGDDAIAEKMRLSASGPVIIGNGTTVSHAGALGPSLIIDQLGNDDAAIVLASSDVTTVLTSIVPGTATTNDYMQIQKFAAATGGVTMLALGENAAVTTNLRFESYGGQAGGTHTTSGRSLIEMYASQHDGANALADLGNATNAFGVVVRTGSADSTKLMVDENGEIWNDGTVTAFDAYDDVSLVRAFSKERTPDGIIENHWDQFVRGDKAKLVELGILGDDADGGRPLVNMSKLQRLHNGAIYQLYSLVMEVVAALPASAQKKLSGQVQARLGTV